MNEIPAARPSRRADQPSGRDGRPVSRKDRVLTPYRHLDSQFGLGSEGSGRPVPSGTERRPWLRLLVVAGTIVGIALLHWATPMGSPSLHLIHVALRKLFLVPVLLAGLWFGLRGGALAAAATTALYLPFVATRWSGQTLENVNQIGEVFSIWVIGLVVGLLAGRQRRTLEAAATSSHLAREQLEGVVDAAGVGMMLVEEGPTLRWMSGRASEWLAFAGSAVDRRCPLIGAGESGCELCVVQAVFATGRPATAERHRLDASGTTKYFRHTATALRNPAGEVIQVVEVIEDTTGRKALEEEALRAGKLSVLGRLAAGIAHEIGNPLASMSTRLQLLERRIEDREFLVQSVQVLRDQIQRISRILRGVSDFGRVRRQRTTWRVRDLIEETAGIVALDPRAVDIDLVVEADAGSIHAVRDQVGQILLNLLLNAAEAMPEGGTVRIESRTDDGQLRLMVEDEGPGVDSRAREHLFEPFFTTKTEGTGLGLSISYGFAAAHNGRIEAENRPDGGARFVLVLPLGEVP